MAHEKRMLTPDIPDTQRPGLRAPLRRNAQEQTAA